MRPPSPITRATARDVKNTESTFSRIVVAHCSSDIPVSGTASACQTPAFATKMSTPPSAVTVAATSDSAPSRVAMFAARAKACTPIRSSSFTIRWASSDRVRYPIITSAPARASVRAVAAPMPRDQRERGGVRDARGGLALWFPYSRYIPLGGRVWGAGGTPAVAAEEQRPAPMHRGLNHLQGTIQLRFHLGSHGCRERGKLVK